MFIFHCSHHCKGPKNLKETLQNCQKVRHPLCNTAFERRGRFPAAGCNLLALPELRSPSFLFITRYKSGKFLLPSQTRSLKVFARESGHLFRFVECRNNNNLFHFRTDGRSVFAVTCKLIGRTEEQAPGVES